jgi:acyl carrier protein
VRDRLVEVMGSVFGRQAADVSEDMALGRTKDWDSLRQMSLIMALEEEFAVSFTNEEVVEMIS